VVAVKLLIALVLLFFDAWALYVGLHPHVSEAYRQYYITHQISTDEYLKIQRAQH
jgi:hypothetical protein